MLFALDVIPRGSWTVLAVTGEVELATAPRVRQRIVGLVGEGHHHLVLDLSGVDFVDSVGLGVVVGALKRTRSHGGDLLVSGADERVRRLFAVTRLDEIVELYDDVEAALASPVATATVAGAPTDPVAESPSPVAGHVPCSHEVCADG